MTYDCMTPDELALWREAGAVEIGRSRLVVHDVTFFDRIVAGG